MKFESQLAESVFKSKYLLEGETTPEEAVERIVKAVAKVYPEIEQEARDYINKQWFIPAGGIWRAANNPKNNVSHVNCTTLTPPEDNLESIFNSLYKWAKYAAYGQGEGIDISNLRPKGSLVHNSSRTSTGAVSFMSLYDAVLKVIAQQGRRGASLISIKDSHPDIEDFISIKDKPETDKSRIDTANISIQVTDAFMKAVEEDSDWLLHYENKYERIEKVVKARELFEKICHMAWKRGDPGLQFIDIAKYNSNSDALGYPIVSTNAPVVGSSLVLTKKGLFTIKELFDSNEEVEIVYDPIVEKNEKELKCLNLISLDKPSWRKASFKEYKNQEVIEIKLNDGLSLFSNGEHKWFTTKGYKETRNLKINDKIVLTRKGYSELEDISIDENSMEYKEALVCGWLTGDGWLGNNYLKKEKTEHKNIGFVWRKGYEDFYNILKEVYKTITGETISYIRDRGTSSYARVASSVFYNYMKNNYGYENHKYIVPDQAFKSYTFAVGFLRGLFQTDGSIDKIINRSHRIILSSSNIEVISKVNKLLLNWFGIKANIAERKNQKGVPYFVKSTGEQKVSNFKNSWNLIISSIRDIEKFNKNIGFIYGDKKQYAEEYEKNNFYELEYSKTPKYKTLKIKEIIFHKEKQDMYCAVVEEGHSLIIDGVVSSNCSEQWLDPENVCNLSHINLAKFKEYKTEGFIKLIQFGIKFLNAVRINEINENRSPTKLQHEKLQLAPRVGLGFTGFADYLIDKKVVYGSQQSLEEMAFIGTCMAKYSILTSYELGKKYGSFKAYDKEKFKKSGYIQRLLKENVITEDMLDYQFNIATTTIAPAGTGSLISNNGGSGIEPLFSRYMVRRERSTTKDWKEWFTFNAYVERYLKEQGLEVTKENADKLTEPWWVMSFDVDPIAKVKLVAEAQKWIDSSISVTFNLPEDATVEDVKNVYMEAWRHNLKGVTVYREGSLGGVLITEKSYNKQQKEQQKESKKDDSYERRPQSLDCDIYEAKYKEHKFIVLVGLKDNEPYEVFITPNDEGLIDIEKNKKGKIVKVKSGHYDLVVENGVVKTMINNIGKQFDSMYGTLSRMVSMSIRHKVPLQFIVDQLNKDSSFVAFEKVLSRILKKYIKDNTSTKKKCPSCGSELIYQDGCISCSNSECAYSKCD